MVATPPAWRLNSDSGYRLIVDAGTGMRVLGAKLADGHGPVKVDLVMTHIHLDHLLGFPMFAPLYREGAHVRVGGWPKGYQGLTSFFRTPHSLGLFPVSLMDLPSRLEQAEDLKPPRFGPATCWSPPRRSTTPRDAAATVSSRTAGPSTS